MKYRSIIQRGDSQIQKVQFGGAFKSVMKWGIKNNFPIVGATKTVARTLPDIGQKIRASAYKHISPLGYVDDARIPFRNLNKELWATAKEIVTPGKVKLKDGKPEWVHRAEKYYEKYPEEARKIIPGQLEIQNMVPFRQEAWAIATKQKQPLKYYIKNSDGTYSYNIEEINKLTANNKNGRKQLEGTVIAVNGSPEQLAIAKPLNTYAYDPITMNGGFVNVKLTPQRVVPTQTASGTQTYIGQPKMILEDVWDIQPFKDVSRSKFPKLTKLGIKYPHTPFGRFRNLEVIDAIRGNKFKLKHEIPADQVHVYVRPIQTFK